MLPFLLSLTTLVPEIAFFGPPKQIECVFTKEETKHAPDSAHLNEITYKKVDERGTIKWKIEFFDNSVMVHSSFVGLNLDNQEVYPAITNSKYAQWSYIEKVPLSWDPENQIRLKVLVNRKKNTIKWTRFLTFSTEIHSGFCN